MFNCLKHFASSCWSLLANLGKFGNFQARWWKFYKKGRFNAFASTIEGVKNKIKLPTSDQGRELWGCLLHLKGRNKKSEKEKKRSKTIYDNQVFMK